MKPIEIASIEKNAKIRKFPQGGGAGGGEVHTPISVTFSCMDFFCHIFSAILTVFRNSDGGGGKVTSLAFICAQC